MSNRSQPLSATPSRSAASPIAEAEAVVFGDEVINDRTYFLCRTRAFWASVVLMVSVGIIMGTWQAFFTHHYIAYMLFSAETEDTNLIDATRRLCPETWCKNWRPPASSYLVLLVH
jgi:hypothetical protein